MKQILKNSEIYSYATKLLALPIQDLTLPVKVQFYLQKNIATITKLGQEIEETRMRICNKYGTYHEEDNNFTFDTPDRMRFVQDELKDLLDLTQNVEIYPIKLSWFGDLNLDTKTVGALLFMIEDENEENA